MQDSNIQWDHSHNFGVDNTSSQSKVKIVFWLTTVIMVLEITAGTWSGSMALLADGWHMGTHSAAFLITIFAYSYATKHANNKSFSFGTGKVNYLGGFASAIALAIVALMMAIESVQRIVEPQSIHFNEAIIVACIGLAVNIISAVILKDDHHHHHHHHGHDHHDHHDSHKHSHDHNMKAAYFHVLADALTSVLAIAALLVGKYIGLLWMDPLMGIVGAIVISHWSYGLIKESSAVLLDRSIDEVTLEKIAKAFNEKDILVNDIHVWKIAASHQAVILSISTGKPENKATYENVIKQFIPHASHISLQVNR